MAEADETPNVTGQPTGQVTRRGTASFWHTFADVWTPPQPELHRSFVERSWTDVLLANVRVRSNMRACFDASMSKIGDAHIYEARSPEPTEREIEGAAKEILSAYGAICTILYAEADRSAKQIRQVLHIPHSRATQQSQEAKV